MVQMQKHRFKCSRCGGNEFKTVSYNGRPHGFYEGHFMCATCGTSLSTRREENGDFMVLNYYCPEFYRVEEPVQLSLF